MTGTKAEREIAALRRRVSSNPGDLVGRHNLAVALRTVGRFEEALGEVELAYDGGLRGAETRTVRANLLADLARYDEAVTEYRKLLAVHPDAIAAHETLSRLLPQRGQRATALDSYRAALNRAPQLGMLWVSAMQAACDLGDHLQLLSWAKAANARFGNDTMITVFAAQAMAGLGDFVEARNLLNNAVAADPDYVPAITTLAFYLLQHGDARAAERHLLRATVLEPDNQSAWSLLTVAWRLLDDARETWLADYERQVMWSDLDIDCGALAVRLTGLHDTLAAPADQSLRGGTQTRGDLFSMRDPLIEQLAKEIKRSVEIQLAALPDDPSHPFLRRKAERIIFEGSWSVRLLSKGYHISHIHPKGWLSSACYIALPAGLESDIGEGALEFGVPDAKLGLSLEPRRTLAPIEGRLVIFPSYYWHGTRRFVRNAPRLTVAFDALPGGREPG